MNERTCATPMCRRSAREGDLMCKRCWRIVPAPLRREVWTTWKASSAAVGDPAARDRYRAAVAKACAAVTTTLTAQLSL